MTLAIAILLFGISSVGVPIQSPPVQASNPPEQSPAQSASPSSNTQSGPEQSGATPPQSSSETAKPAASQGAGQEKATPQKRSAQKRTRKKKAVTSGCDSTRSSAPSAPSEVPGSGSTAQGAQGAQPNPNPAATSSNSPAPKDCPPAITVVRHGGEKEPSIQLAGGPGGDEASQKRDATNQMLVSAEANLKKISAIQLSQAQQDTVTQIRQFVDQSKAALAAGELERGHTLAWKAQLLSEDLLKPQK